MYSPENNLMLSWGYLLVSLLMLVCQVSVSI